MYSRSKLFIWKKIILIFFISLCIVVAYKYVYRKQRIISDETTSFQLTTIEVEERLKKNQVSFLKNYVDKTVLVTGKITSVNDNNIVLDDFVSVQFIKHNEALVKGIAISVKGRLVGYDDLLEELKIDQSTIINKQ